MSKVLRLDLIHVHKIWITLTIYYLISVVIEAEFIVSVSGNVSLESVKK